MLRAIEKKLTLHSLLQFVSEGCRFRIRLKHGYLHHPLEELFRNNRATPLIRPRSVTPYSSCCNEARVNLNYLGLCFAFSWARANDRGVRQQIGAVQMPIS